MKQSIYGYRGDGFAQFVKVTCNDPKDISKARNKVETGVMVAGLDKPCTADTTFESNLAYLLRFMIDCKVSDMIDLYDIVLIQYTRYLVLIGLNFLLDNIDIPKKGYPMLNMKWKYRK